MPELSLRDVSLAFGGAPLLDKISLQVEAGERICLLGRNGAGKSSLLRLLAGEVPPDAGVIDRRQGLRAATLPQDVPRDMVGTVFEVVAGGLGPAGAGLCRYHELSHRLAESGDQTLLPELLAAQKVLEEGGGWELQQRTEQIIIRLKLPEDAQMRSLSGGVKRRTLLARALVSEPDLLLLDEPTNHLDIESIAWLEDFLQRARIALVFVTHDRSFLRALATRIVEIDRGRLFDFACDYDTFLVRKEELLHAEAQEWARFDRKMAQEEVWIRQGIKARRTRNEGRVRALKAMREESRRRRERSGTAKLQLLEAERSGKLVAEVTGITFSYDEKPIVREFSTRIIRGDRVGIIGPNGAGKTTLLKLLLGQLAPQQGQVRLGTNMEVLYFDQLREQLDPDRTVQQNLGRRRTRFSSAASRATSSAICRIFSSPPTGRVPRCASSPAASAAACCWRGCSPARRTSLSWMSRLTISIWKPSTCLKSSSPILAVRSFWSAMTATFSTAS